MLSPDYRITTPLQSLSPHSEMRHLFLTGREWRIGLLVSAAAGIGVAWVSLFISVWIGVTVFFVTLTAYHMRYASRFIVPFPHIAILISALQYVLAAWVGFYYPAEDPLYSIDSLPFYLSYGGPVIFAICVGWSLSLLRLRPTPQPAVPPNAKLLTELDILLAVGLVAVVVGRKVQIPSLAFVLVLVANLRYVGVYGRMVVRAPGWSWRLAIVLGSEVLFAAETAMFHPLLLWTCWTVAVWMYCFKPSQRGVLCALLAGGLFLPAFQEAKWRARGHTGEDDLIESSEMEAMEKGRLDKTVDLAFYLAAGFKHAATFDLDDQFIADTAVRYNQGWIVNRVMFLVPGSAPYAKGDTIKTAAIAAVLPRAIAAEKFRSGGREYMAKYAGIELNETTAMNLGYAGEMYANFGFVGGVIGCGIYALLMGLLFRWLCHRAFLHPLWWSVVPFICFAALKAEDGIADTLNWTVKSCLVIAGIYFVFPGFGAALRQHVARPATRFIHPAVPLRQHPREA